MSTDMRRKKQHREQIEILMEARRNEHMAHQLRGQGLTIAEIAKRLDVWPRTVIRYLSHPPRPLISVE
jgi:DNA-binding NarL/FixJ family response regulator